METAESNTNTMRDPVLAAIVLAFSALAYIIGGVHEPWSDEAQAWLIARDAPLYDLLFVLPHGELNPSLWHLMLILPSTYLDYEVLRYIALFFGILGVAVFVYLSPFSKPIKLLLPFSYFVFFQYTVVARSYCLFALIIFAIAAFYKHRFERPFTYSILIALLVYSHSFGALVSLGLIGTYVLDLIRQRHNLGRHTIKRSLVCIGIPVAVGCFLLYQVFPIQQRTLSTRWHFDPGYIMNVLNVILDETFTGITLLSLAILLISAFWFWQRKVLLLYLTMIAPFYIVAAIKFYNDWHLGLLFLVWFLVLWISFDPKIVSRAPSLIPYTRKAILGCIYVVLGFHVYWGAAASYADFHGNYSCGGDVARLLKDNNIGERRVYATNFWTIAALPYFSGKMFYNVNPGSDIGYWTFFVHDKIEKMSTVLASQPDAIVLGRKYLEKDYDGYVRKNYKGDVYWKDGIKESNHCTVYIRKDLYGEAPAGQ